MLRPGICFHTAAQRPFRIEGDISYGPGTNDMKGGLAVGLFALQALRPLARFSATFSLVFDDIVTGG